MDLLKFFKVAYLHIQQIRNNISIHLDSCLSPPDDCESNVHSPSTSVFVSTNSWGNYLAAKCSTMFTS